MFLLLNKFKEFLLLLFRHPYVAIFHLLFRGAAVFTYIFFGLYDDTFITTFVFVILLLSADFWTVKNITGRLLVGLRWWNYIDDNGESHWVYESKQVFTSTTEANRNSLLIVVFVPISFWRVISFFFPRAFYLLFVANPMWIVCLSTANPKCSFHLHCLCSCFRFYLCVWGTNLCSRGWLTLKNSEYFGWLWYVSQWYGACYLWSDYLDSSSSGWYVHQNGLYCILTLDAQNWPVV